MSIRAKFTCASITDFGSSKEVKMSAVYSSTSENADFADATPSGSFTMQINASRPAALYFTPGKSYYLDISEVPVAQ